MSARIYLDHAATTPMIAEARDTYVQAFERDYNASSIHSEGRESHAKLDEARTRVANVLSLPRRLVRFTSGGSESDALAILGLARAHRRGKRRRILTGAIEHHAVLHACDALANEDFEIVILPVDSNGIIDEESYAAQLDERTLLVSIHLANNEIGVIEPIAALAARAHEAGAYLHCDAVQAARWLDLSLESLGADLLSLSGHKFGGPKGVGVLAMRSELPLEPLIFGGGQEFGLRAGTENLPAIVAFTVAFESAVAQHGILAQAVTERRKSFESDLSARIPGLCVNAATSPRLPNISNISIPGVDSEALLMRLDLDGIAASAGSACTSGVIEPSHVIAALGLPPALQRGVLRLSLAPQTTSEELADAATILAGAVERVR